MKRFMRPPFAERPHALPAVMDSTAQSEDGELENSPSLTVYRLLLIEDFTERTARGDPSRFEPASE
jgi:hypothetical protein